MNKQPVSELLVEWLLKALKWVDETEIAYIPYTYVTKAMVEGGIKCGLYLCRAEKEDEEITDELITPISPAFVNVVIENPGEEINGYFLSGNIVFLGYNINVKNFNLLGIDRATVEDFSKCIEVSLSSHSYPAYIPCYPTPQDSIKTTAPNIS